MEDRSARNPDSISGVSHSGVGGGSPLDIRDHTLKPHEALVDGRPGGPPTGGFTAEAAHRSSLHHTVTPSVSEKGWSLGGMAIPALIIVALIGSLVAFAF